jgi:putative transferase (TIGR04331 family)
MWQQLDSSLEVYRGAKSTTEQLNESRLSIGTYNGMGILETLSANYPTIIFWNPTHWELRESAKPLFDVLIGAGIFHETPQSAASKVNEIYQDVQSWWMSAETQRVRKIFCDQFCNTSKPLIRLKEELLKLL